MLTARRPCCFLSSLNCDSRILHCALIRHDRVHRDSRSPREQPQGHHAAHPEAADHHLHRRFRLWQSSIVFDTIATEAQRQLYENFSLVIRSFLPKYPPPDADAIENLSMAVIVNQKRLGGGSHSTVGTITDIYTLLRLLFSRIGKPPTGPSSAFSFNDPKACAASATAWDGSRPRGSASAVQGPIAGIPLNPDPLILPIVLDVTVHDARRVGGAQGRRHLDRDVERRADR